MQSDWQTSIPIKQKSKCLVMIFKAYLINLILLPRPLMFTSFQLHQSFCSLIMPTFHITIDPGPASNPVLYRGPSSLPSSMLLPIEWGPQVKRLAYQDPVPPTLLSHTWNCWNHRKLCPKSIKPAPTVCKDLFPSLPPEAVTPTGMYICRACGTQHIMEYNDIENNY